MKFLTLILLLTLASCEHRPRLARNIYFVDWEKMPEEFNYPQISNVLVEEKDITLYREKQRLGKCGPIRGPFLVDWRGNIMTNWKGEMLLN